MEMHRPDAVAVRLADTVEIHFWPAIPTEYLTLEADSVFVSAGQIQNLLTNSNLRISQNFNSYLFGWRR
jgi:hypothetical protein